MLKSYVVSTENDPEELEELTEKRSDPGEDSRKKARLAALRQEQLKQRYFISTFFRSEKHYGLSEDLKTHKDKFLDKLRLKEDYITKAEDLFELYHCVDESSKPPEVCIESDLEGPGLVFKVSGEQIVDGKIAPEQAAKFLEMVQQDLLLRINQDKSVLSYDSTDLGNVRVDSSARDKIYPPEPSKVQLTKNILAGVDEDLRGKDNPLVGRMVRTEDGIKVELTGESREVEKGKEYQGMVDMDKRLVWIPRNKIENVLKAFGVE